LQIGLSLAGAFLGDLPEQLGIFRSTGVLDRGLVASEWLAAIRNKPVSKCRNEEDDRYAD
jgi:hypothetical protein